VCQGKIELPVAPVAGLEGLVVAPVDGRRGLGFGGFEDVLQTHQALGEGQEEPAGRAKAPVVGEHDGDGSKHERDVEADPEDGFEAGAEGDDFVFWPALGGDAGFDGLVGGEVDVEAQNQRGETEEKV